MTRLPSCGEPALRGDRGRARERRTRPRRSRRRGFGPLRVDPRIARAPRV